jgi:HAD superfamily hydrolase (TIGR01509 family)
MSNKIGEIVIDTVVFDLGGTLVEYAGAYDAWPDLETPGLQAAYQFLRQTAVLPPFPRFRDAGFALLPVLWRRAQQTDANFRVDDLLVQTLHALELPPASEIEIGIAAQKYTAAIQAQAFPMPHAPETVAALKAAGFKIGLVSNTMFAGAAHQADMARFGLVDYFDAMVFSADENKWKPTPLPFFQVLEKLDAAGATAVYVGDDPASDVAGAHAAGMRAVYFRSSGRFHLPDHLQPDATINSLTDLPDILAAWKNNRKRIHR